MSTAVVSQMLVKCADTLYSVNPKSDAFNDKPLLWWRDNENTETGGENYSAYSKYCRFNRNIK